MRKLIILFVVLAGVFAQQSEAQIVGYGYYARGDADGDGKVSVSDLTTLIDYLLNGEWQSPAESCETFVANGVSFNMVKVEHGTFIMGNDNDASTGFTSSSPAHQVTLTKSYYIGQTEVTQSLWSAVMGSNPSYYTRNGRGSHPVEWVTWNDCQTFISKLNEMTGLSFRLPTEAEWEFAARGGNKSQGYIYSGSDAAGAVAWYVRNTLTGNTSTDVNESYPVALLFPNELGIYDMSGNVCEWVYDSTYGYKADSPAVTDPIHDTNASRLYRGGSYDRPVGWCMVSNRSSLNPNSSSPNLGLRLALTAE